jgi:hypothetical protein
MISDLSDKMRAKMGQFVVTFINALLKVQYLSSAGAMPQCMIDSISVCAIKMRITK